MRVLVRVIQKGSFRDAVNSTPHHADPLEVTASSWVRKSPKAQFGLCGCRCPFMCASFGVFRAQEAHWEDTAMSCSMHAPDRPVYKAR